jgi:hypothetical protein
MKETQKDKLGKNKLQDPRKVLNEITTEIKKTNRFGRKEAIMLLLEELLKEQTGELN